MPENVIIRHPKTGQECGVSRADFKRRKLFLDPKDSTMKTYEAAGFEIVSNIDGSEIDEPEPKHEPKKDD